MSDGQVWIRWICTWAGGWVSGLIDEQPTEEGEISVDRRRMVAFSHKFSLWEKDHVDEIVFGSLFCICVAAVRCCKMRVCCISSLVNTRVPQLWNTQPGRSEGLLRKKEKESVLGITGIQQVLASIFHDALVSIGWCIPYHTYLDSRYGCTENTVDQ